MNTNVRSVDAAGGADGLEVKALVLSSRHKREYEHQVDSGIRTVM